MASIIFKRRIYIKEVFSYQKILFALILLFLPIFITSCGHSVYFTSSEQFETMLLTLYSSIEADGTLIYQVPSNIGGHQTQILDVLLFGMTVDDAELKMVYGSHMCHVSPSKDLTHRCTVKVFFKLFQVIL
jgi:hypothetical protein